jgi:hypothetical protein
MPPDWIIVKRVVATTEKSSINKSRERAPKLGSIVNLKILDDTPHVVVDVLQYISVIFGCMEHVNTQGNNMILKLKIHITYGV